MDIIGGFRNSKLLFSMGISSWIKLPLVVVVVVVAVCCVPSCGGTDGTANYVRPPLESDADSFTDEQRLLRALTTNYDPSVRPVFDNRKAVVIQVGITLTQIIDVDEKNQVLTTNVWLDQQWIDEKLTWNETDFNNISIIRIPCDLIWLPDIVLYNSVDNHNKGYMRSLAMVHSNGNVFWPPIVRMRSSCKMDITFFPFDDQLCHLKLGSWAYDGFQVDVTNRSLNVDLSNYVNNGEWELLGTKCIRSVISYSCCPEPFIDVTFYILIRRRVLYYFLNVIIPCMLLSTLSLTGFLLPPDSGEKVTLGLTVLLAFSVFMLLVAENMPPTSEYIPLIGIYLTVIMAMSAMSVALSVFVLNCHHRGSMLRRPPKCVRKLSSFVAKCLCMRLLYLNKPCSCSPKTKPTPSNRQPMSYTAFHEGIITSSSSTIPGSPQQNITCSTSLRTSPSTPQSTQGSVDQRPPSSIDTHGGCNGFSQPTSNTRHHHHHRPHQHSIRNDVLKDTSRTSTLLEGQIIHYLKSVLEAYDKTRGEKASVLEWQEVARVLDKFFFSLFLTITVCATVFLLLLSPVTKNVDFPDN